MGVRPGPGTLELNTGKNPGKNQVFMFNPAVGKLVFMFNPAVGKTLQLVGCRAACPCHLGLLSFTPNVPNPGAHRHLIGQSYPSGP